MSDEKQEQATLLKDMREDAKTLAEDLKNVLERPNPPSPQVKLPINELIKKLAGAVQAMDAVWETDPPGLGGLRTAWQELQDLWARHYPFDQIPWAPHQSWKGCWEKAEEFSTLMRTFSP